MDRKHVPRRPHDHPRPGDGRPRELRSPGVRQPLDTTFGAVRIAWDYGGSHNDRVSDVVADDSTDSLYLVGYLASETTDDDWGVVRSTPRGTRCAGASSSTAEAPTTISPPPPTSTATVTCSSRAG